MTIIIPLLLSIIKYLNKILFKFQCFLIHRFMSNLPSDNPVAQQYRTMQVDDFPIIEKRELLDHKVLLQQYLDTHRKPLKPINHRSSNLPPKGTTCPICNAPYEYIYDNSGGRGQLKCKVCHSTFFPHKSYLEKLVFKCPHCRHTLTKKRDRKNFFVYSCQNRKCSFYLQNIASLTPEQQADFSKNPHKYKMHYYHRVFDIELDSLKQEPNKPHSVDLSRIRKAKYVLGLALTYHINYGLSLRQTASILWDIHRIKISHQTIANYAASAARILKPYVDDYPYDLSSQVSICGDETYVKVLGKKHYVFFIMDVVKKIITSYEVFANRDGISAIKAVYATLAKFRKIPENLVLIFDGNPIYLLAQHFFAQHNIHFDVKQVIGLTNNDEVSAEYRWLKQVIERLNRTFKAVYRGKNGFNSLERANEYMVLFVAFFNFLRVHSSLNYNVPVCVPEIANMPDMPSKWLELLRLSYEHICRHQHTA